MPNHYQVWSDAFWNAKGHGLTEQEAEKHAAAKVAIFDRARANQRREAAQGPEGAPLTYHDYINN